MDLTTEQGVQSWLSARETPARRVCRLDEGFSSFVYRATLVTPRPDGSDTVIIKHTANYAARARQYSMDPSRLVYEYNFLHLVAPTLPSTPSDKVWPLRTPTVYSFSAEHHALQTSDHAPCQAIGLFLRSQPAGFDISTTSAIGDRLGTFLAAVHNLALSDPSILSSFAANDSARALSAKAYFTNLPSAARRRGFPFTAADRNDDDDDDDRVNWLDALATQQADVVLGRSSSSSSADPETDRRAADEVLTMGDFWPGNVLVTAAHELVVIDFELSKPGRPSFDVGQMAAELWMLHHFELVRSRKAAAGEEEEIVAATTTATTTPALLVLGAFLRTYRAACKPSFEAVEVAIRFGAHLITIGPMTREAEFGTEAVLEVVKLGVELCREGAHGRADTWEALINGNTL